MIEREIESYVRTDIGFLQSGRVVDTVSSYGDNGSSALTTFDDDQLLLRWRAGKDDLRVGRGQFTQLTTVNDGRFGVSGIDSVDGNVKTFGNVFHRLALFGNDADRSGNSFGSDGVVTSNHYDCKYQHTFVLINSKFVENFRSFYLWYRPKGTWRRHRGRRYVVDRSWTWGRRIWMMLLSSSIYHQNKVNLEKGKSVPSIQMIRSCP